MTRTPHRTILPVLPAVALLIACQDSPQEISDSAALGLAGGQVIVVNTTTELVTALSPENAGRRILVRAGTYDVSAPLTVPDGATLEGEGVMEFGADGLPKGFASGTRTALNMIANTPGDLLTLGDGVTLRGLEISDLAGRSGNVVAVVSRDPGDRISATIAEVGIVNPNPSGIVPAGPTGHGLVVLTRNPNLGAPPLAHAGAALTARVSRSLVRSPAGGGGLFAFNFAPLARVSVALDGNVIGGGITASGGISRPDAVHDSEVRIESHRNLYRGDGADPCAARALAWNLTGGAGPPAPLPVPETARNALRIQSVDDRIEGFARGILATAARRFFGAPTAGPSTDNSIDLVLLGAKISTPSCGGAPFVADLELAGAFASGDALFPGDGNVLRAVIRNVTGSGLRFNQYANADGPSGPLAPELQGNANRLELAGNLRAFMSANALIDPTPGAQFFRGGGN